MALSLVALLEHIGGWFFSRLRNALLVLRLLGDCLALCVTGRLYNQPVRLSAILNQIVELGLKSVPMVLLFGASFGAIIGLQLTDFFTSVDYLLPVMKFLGHFVTREQAPLIVGILLAARIGGSITSELSAMVIDNEVAALHGMGIDPIRYLIAPTLVAMLIVTPVLMLVMVACELSTLAIYLLLERGIAPIFSLSVAIDGITTLDLAVTLAKGILFGAIIIGIAAQTALNTLERGRSTGSSTTYSIAYGITIILIVNTAISIFVAD